MLEVGLVDILQLFLLQSLETLLVGVERLLLTALRHLFCRLGICVCFEPSNALFHSSN
jgi:hypothetical protein